MIRSVRELQQINPGFDAAGVLTMQLSLPARNYNRAQALSFPRQTVERLAALPGVEFASLGSDLPLSGQTSSGPIQIEGRPAPPAGQENIFYRHQVTPDYFKTLGMSLLRGRPFSWDDNESAPNVAIVSEGFAKRHWPGEEAIGRRVQDGGGSDLWWTVVGVVSDVKFRGLPDNPDPHPDVYFPLAQAPDRDLMIAVRSRVEPLSLAASVRRAVSEIDPNLPAFNAITLEEATGNQTANSSFTSLLLSVFSGLALFLAVVGVYGVMSYSVNQRRHEIGVRMALGAQGRDIFRLLAGRGMGLVMAGLALGIVLALALTRLMSQLLYGVGASDPLTFGAISLLMIAVSLLVSYLPARRASRVDPMAAVRYE
jgi:predicted permease